jgi:hypothetical protein
VDSAKQKVDTEIGDDDAEECKRAIDEEGTIA